ncbi:MAG: hypothetical protein V1702_00590, partial [Candidatus Woesearchaeota archaeon]
MVATLYERLTRIDSVASAVGNLEDFRKRTQGLFSGSSMPELPKLGLVEISAWEKYAGALKNVVTKKIIEEYETNPILSKAIEGHSIEDAVRELG